MNWQSAENDKNLIYRDSETTKTVDNYTTRICISLFKREKEIKQMLSSLPKTEKALKNATIYRDLLFNKTSSSDYSKSKSLKGMMNINLDKEFNPLIKELINTFVLPYFLTIKGIDLQELGKWLSYSTGVKSYSKIHKGTKNDKELYKTMMKKLVIMKSTEMEDGRKTETEGFDLEEIRNIIETEPIFSKTLNNPKLENFRMLLNFNPEPYDTSRFSLLKRIIINILFYDSGKKSDSKSISGFIADEPLIRCKTCDEEGKPKTFICLKCFDEKSHENHKLKIVNLKNRILCSVHSKVTNDAFEEILAWVFYTFFYACEMQLSGMECHVIEFFKNLVEISFDSQEKKKVYWACLSQMLIKNTSSFQFFLKHSCDQHFIFKLKNPVQNVEKCRCTFLQNIFRYIPVLYRDKESNHVILEFFFSLSEVDRIFEQEIIKMINFYLSVAEPTSNYPIEFIQIITQLSQILFSKPANLRLISSTSHLELFTSKLMEYGIIYNFDLDCTKDKSSFYDIYLTLFEQILQNQDLIDKLISSSEICYILRLVNDYAIINSQPETLILPSGIGIFETNFIDSNLYVLRLCNRIFSKMSPRLWDLAHDILSEFFDDELQHLLSLENHSNIITSTLMSFFRISFLLVIQKKHNQRDDCSQYDLISEKFLSLNFVESNRETLFRLSLNFQGMIAEWMTLYDSCIESLNSSSSKYFLREYRLYDSDFVITQILCLNDNSEDLFIEIFNGFFRKKFNLEQIINFSKDCLRKKELCQSSNDLIIIFSRFLVSLSILDSSFLNLIMSLKSKDYDDFDENINNKWMYIYTIKQIFSDELWPVEYYINLKKLPGLKNHEKRMIEAKREIFDDPFMFHIYYRDLSKNETIIPEELKLDSYFIRIQEKLFKSNLTDWLHSLLMSFDPMEDIYWINPFLLLLYQALYLVENKTALNIEPELVGKLKKNFVEEEKIQRKIKELAQYLPENPNIKKILQLLRMINHSDEMIQEDTEDKKKPEKEKKMENSTTSSKGIKRRSTALRLSAEDIGKNDIDSIANGKISCQHCKENVNFITGSGIIPIFISAGNVRQQPFIISEENFDLFFDQIRDVNLTLLGRDFAIQTETFPLIGSCNHIYHEACYNKFVKKSYNKMFPFECNCQFMHNLSLNVSSKSGSHSILLNIVRAIYGGDKYIPTKENFSKLFFLFGNLYFEVWENFCIYVKNFDEYMTTNLFILVLLFEELKISMLSKYWGLDFNTSNIKEYDSFLDRVHSKATSSNFFKFNKSKMEDSLTNKASQKKGANIRSITPQMKKYVTKIDRNYVSPTVKSRIEFMDSKPRVQTPKNDEPRIQRPRTASNFRATRIRNFSRTEADTKNTENDLVAEGLGFSMEKNSMNQTFFEKSIVKFESQEIDELPSYLEPLDLLTLDIDKEYIVSKWNEHMREIKNEKFTTFSHDLNYIYLKMTQFFIRQSLTHADLPFYPNIDHEAAYDMISKHKDIKEDFLKELNLWVEKILVTSIVLGGKNHYLAFVRKMQLDKDVLNSEKRIDALLSYVNPKIKFYTLMAKDFTLRLSFRPGIHDMLKKSCEITLQKYFYMPNKIPKLITVKRSTLIHLPEKLISFMKMVSAKNLKFAKNYVMCLFCGYVDHRSLYQEHNNQHYKFSCGIDLNTFRVYIFFERKYLELGALYQNQYNNYRYYEKYEDFNCTLNKAVIYNLEKLITQNRIIESVVKYFRNRDKEE